MMHDARRAARLDPSRQEPLPNMTLTIDRVDATAGRPCGVDVPLARAAGGASRGISVLDLRDGHILKPVTAFLPPISES